MPNEASRLAILRVIMRHENVAPDTDLAFVASQTHGFSGSDLKVSLPSDCACIRRSSPWPACACVHA